MSMITWCSLLQNECLQLTKVYVVEREKVFQVLRTNLSRVPQPKLHIFVENRKRKKFGVSCETNLS